jgi:amino acid adenylation domain-containing protein
MSVFVEKALAHADRSPDTVVVTDKWRTWTWSDLVARASAYGEAAVEHFPEADGTSAVPILVGRSGETPAAALGLLMAGRAVAPLSPQQPTARLNRCLSKLGVTDLIDARAPQEQDDLQLPLKTIVPDKAADRPASVGDADPCSLLYILFTSGSTGEPKGVMCDHNNLLNTVKWSSDFIDWRSDDVVGVATQFSFDISWFDLLMCFYHGVPLSVLSDASDVRSVARQIADDGITSIFGVPAFFSQFVRAGLVGALRDTKLRRILSGGDFFPPAHILEWMDEASHVQILNVWGPTETSIVNTMHPVDNSDRPLLDQGKYPPVGHSHPRMPFVLIDEGGTAVTEPGIRGEIWMRGDCVSLGYLQDEALTKEVYTSFEGTRAFRTADIGYLDDEGRLFVAGRVGSVAKVSGYRIDLGEVEGALATLESVHLAGVFVKEVLPGINELWAGVELTPGRLDLDIFDAKKALRRMLPNYMVPKRLLVLEKLPLNANGKVDRAEIVAFHSGHEAVITSTPGDDTELQ